MDIKILFLFTSQRPQLPVNNTSSSFTKNNLLLIHLSMSSSEAKSTHPVQDEISRTEIQEGPPLGASLIFNVVVFRLFSDLLTTQASSLSNYYFRNLVRTLAWVFWLLQNFNRISYKVFYIAAESGDTILSIIEPCHSIEASFIHLRAFFFELNCRINRNRDNNSTEEEENFNLFLSSPVQNFRALPIRARIVKLIKVCLMLLPNVFLFYESYVAVRSSRMFFVTVRLNCLKLRFYFGLLISYAVVQRGQVHLILVCAMMSYCALEYLFFNSYIFLLNIFPRLILERAESRMGNILELYVKKPILFIQPLFSFWGALFTDFVQAPVMLREEDERHHVKIRPGTETKVSIFISNMLSNLIIYWYPTARVQLYGYSNPQFRCTLPLSVFTFHRIRTLSYGVRRLKFRDGRLVPGNIFRDSENYEQVDKRIKNVVKYVLRQEGGAVVSYRHKRTLEESCATVEELVAESGITVLWSDVFTGEIKKREAPTAKWINIGLEPYMYFPVIREPNMIDGEERLWISLERRVGLTHNSMMTRMQIPIPYLHFLYYISGKAVRMRAWAWSDITEALDEGKANFADAFAQFNLSQLQSSWSNRCRVMAGMLRQFDVLETELSLDGDLLTAVIYIDNREFQYMCTVLQILNGMSTIYYVEQLMDHISIEQFLTIGLPFVQVSPTRISFHTILTNISYLLAQSDDT